MKRKMLTISFTSLIFFFAFGVQAADVFTSDLKIGMTSMQVKLLQQALNTSFDATVAQSGSGSRGLETEYFGALTKSAVIRFQEKYRSEILVPAGLASGTGFVGGFTRAVLNRLLAPSITSAPAPVQKSAANTAIQNAYINQSSNTDYLSSDSLQMLSPYLPAGFATSSFASASSTIKNSAFSATSNAIISLLKTKFNIILPTGVPTATTSLIIPTKAGAAAPQIYIVEKPNSFADTITIKGTGLANTNTIFTSLGYLANVGLVGGSTLSFKFADLPGFSFYNNVPKGSLSSTTVMFWVYNENGASNVLGPYKIDF